jgi:hypothetical protein
VVTIDVDSGPIGRGAAGVHPLAVTTYPGSHAKPHAPLAHVAVPPVVVGHTMQLAPHAVASVSSAHDEPQR